MSKRIPMNSKAPIAGALELIATQVTQDIRESAKLSTRRIFPNVLEEEFDLIDNMYEKYSNLDNNIHIQR